MVRGINYQRFGEPNDKKVHVPFLPGMRENDKKVHVPFLPNYLSHIIHTIAIFSCHNIGGGLARYYGKE